MNKLLDNPSALMNVKNRLGLNVKHGNSVSIYITNKQVRRSLEDILLNNDKLFMKNKHLDKRDRSILIDNILEKCNDLPKLEAIKKILTILGVDSFIQLVMSGIRSLMRVIKSYVVEKPLQELLD